MKIEKQNWQNRTGEVRVWHYYSALQVCQMRLEVVLRMMVIIGLWLQNAEEIKYIKQDVEVYVWRKGTT